MTAIIIRLDILCFLIVLYGVGHVQQAAFHAGHELLHGVDWRVDGSAATPNRGVCMPLIRGCRRPPPLRTG